MTDDLSPEGINKAHGKATWVCWGCKAEVGLHWHRGWSVAMCRRPECAKGYDDMCAAQEAERESFEGYVAEVMGGSQ